MINTLMIKKLLPITQINQHTTLPTPIHLTRHQHIPSQRTIHISLVRYHHASIYYLQHY